MMEVSVKVITMSADCVRQGEGKGAAHESSTTLL